MSNMMTEKSNVRQLALGNNRFITVCKVGNFVVVVIYLVM